MDSLSVGSDSAMDDFRDMPFDFALKDRDQAETEGENSDECSSYGSDGFSSPAGSMSSLNAHKSEPGDLLCRQHDIGNSIDDTTGGAAICDDAIKPATSTNYEESPSSTSLSLSIPHRGSLRRILSPSSFHVSLNATPTQTLGLSNQSEQVAPSSWPVYVINVSIGQCSQSNAQSVFQSNHNQQSQHQECYHLIFDRQQYELCTRLFALLDTESQSFVGPDCVREFVCLHFPVVKRRDDAIFALQCSEEDSSSPTFDEIWDRTIHCDSRYTSADISTENIDRIGIEGWMVFCRLLGLAHHQESQRRFASRHSQQMMRHKHGGGATRMNPNEVVVVVDNPPPGPPSLISLQSLMDVEHERETNQGDGCIHGWPFCPLPLPALDLDHCLVSTYNSNQQSFGMQLQPMGAVFIEPFSSSKEGDFILRFCSNNSRMAVRSVVRRSYSDFEWLNAILKLHKRPGQGNLCGRILPPFPSKQGGFYHQKHSALAKEIVQSSSNSHQKDISERAIAAAKSGMGMISSMAKSVWTGYVSGSTSSSSPSPSLSRNKARASTGGSPPKWSCSSDPEDLPTEVAHGLERYLNYLLDNHALSTSFPLHAILKASQSGLESTKQILQDRTKHKKRSRTSAVAATSGEGLHSAASVFSSLISKTSNSILRLQEDDDTPWLRAAAHVAMSLQFHGILETTGHETASAKIQHASLPKFRNHPAGSWDEEEPGNDGQKRNSKSSHNLGSPESDSPKSDTNFEAGVINVESELADEQELGGFDMLPSPGPSEEHCVLNAGSAVSVKVGPSKSHPNRSKFVYEITPEQPGGAHDRKDVVLGSIRVENEIDKLRDIIRSINHTLGKLYQSSSSIRSAQDARNAIQLSLLRDVDCWGDSGDELISQRALVDGVAALESFNSAIEYSNKIMTDDILWQSSLATSAVGAVTEVRDAVRASYTATRAKRAAFLAAEKARKVYESCDHTSSKEKIEHTQSEASTAQSHAIHATVVEYEANIAKKRSAVSLAQDVKAWNIHRKRELLQTCVQVAKSQQEACEKAADAWESLRDGLIDSSSCSFANIEIGIWTNPLNISHVCSAPTTSTNSKSISQMSPVPITSTFYANTQEAQASDIPIGLDGSRNFVQNSFSMESVEKTYSTLDEWETGQCDLSESLPDGSNSLPSDVERFTDVCSLKESQQTDTKSSTGHVYCISTPNISHLNEDYFSLHQGFKPGASSDSDENEHHRTTSSIHDSFLSGHDSKPENGPDAMSTSMQSLIDGLMAWGGETAQGNKVEGYQADGMLGTGNESQHSDLLG